jgi:gliding motility-associated-like protein
MVAFKDSSWSNDIISGYQWNFGDGVTSTAKNPSHTYKTAGNYSVSLVTRTQFGCVDSTVYQQPIRVLSSPLIAISGITGSCEPAEFHFTGNLVKGDTTDLTWSWDFGNGQNGNLQDPGVRSFPNPGTYNIKLRVMGSEGCADSATRVATVYPNPVVDAGADTTICLNNDYTLTAKGSESYRWDADPTLSCTGCASPTATPLGHTTYYVTGLTEYGCSARDSVKLQVIRPLKMSVGRGDTICVGATVPLTASGTQSYQWSPALYLDNPNSSSPKSKPDSTIQYRVIGSDEKNCFTDTGYIKIKVYRIPTIDIKGGNNINLKVGESMKLETSSSPDITQWKWFPTQGLSCATCPEPVASPKETITYSVVATNDGTCLSRDQVTITVICNNGNIFVPNTFSPNGDGNNDYFFPRGTGVSAIKNMKVFNRWGQVVFEKNKMPVNNANEGWNGKFNGVAMPTDVYVYILEVVCDNSSIIPIKGNVTLLR